MYPEYTEEYINYKLTYSHFKLANFTIIMNKWTVLRLLQNFEFLLSKNCLYTNKCGHRNVLSKRQVWMSIFHIINFKKKKIRGHRSPVFF